MSQDAAGRVPATTLSYQEVQIQAWIRHACHGVTDLPTSAWTGDRDLYAAFVLWADSRRWEAWGRGAPSLSPIPSLPDWRFVMSMLGYGRRIRGDVHIRPLVVLPQGVAS